MILSFYEGERIFFVIYLGSIIYHKTCHQRVLSLGPITRSRARLQTSIVAQSHPEDGTLERWEESVFVVSPSEQGRLINRTMKPGFRD